MFKRSPYKPNGPIVETSLESEKVKWVGSMDSGLSSQTGNSMDYTSHLLTTHDAVTDLDSVFNKVNLDQPTPPPNSAGTGGGVYKV